MTPRPLSCAALLALALAPTSARAGATPLPALPEKPVRYGQADGPIPVRVTSESSFHDLTSTAGPACFVEEPPPYWIDGDVPTYGRTLELSIGAREPFGLERLVVRGDTAELVRITAEIVFGELVPLARSRITLHPVAELEGNLVYAYRWQSKVIVLTRSAGLPPPPPIPPSHDLDADIPASRCSFTFATLHVRPDGSSRVEQLQGTLPGSRKRFVIDLSVSRTARDPAPLLAVTPRLIAR